MIFSPFTRTGNIGNFNFTQNFIVAKLTEKSPKILDHIIKDSSHRTTKKMRYPLHIYSHRIENLNISSKICLMTLERGETPIAYCLM